MAENILNTSPNYFKEAWNRTQQNFANSPEGQRIKLETQGWKPTTKFTTSPTGGGRMTSFKEETWTSPDNETTIVGPDALQQAMQYSQKYPVKDASQTIFNDLMAGGAGLWRGIGNGGFQLAQKWLPKLSFSSASTAGKGLGAAASEAALWGDATFAVGTSIPTIMDISQNGPNLVNATEMGLSLLPIAGEIPYMYKNIKQYPIDVTKRGIETAMRTTEISNPIPEIKTQLNNMIHGKNGGIPRLLNIGNYILTGYRNGPKGYYNSLSDFIDFQGLVNKNLLNRITNPKGFVKPYTGFLNKYGLRPKIEFEGNDMIDAFLYGKEIDPRYGLIRTDIDYGIFDNYIKENYSNKIIPRYMVNRPADIPQGKLKFESVTGGDGHKPEFGASQDYIVNAAGHQVQSALDTNGDFYTRLGDIWKFNPADYSKKWLDGGNILTKFGLKLVDKLGTPVITYTPWQKEANIADMIQISLKNGGSIPKAKSGIHIKEENKGKFTKSANQAGQSVQEHAKSVLNNPDATPLQKKRANFARNAAKWHKK